MESTSTYWKAPFYCLEEVMEVWLLNAAHMKAVPGRKSDVRDAEWIAQLLEHGLLAPSLVPPPDIRRLRMLTRYREQLMGDRTREIVRLELMLEDASIKLSSVVSSLKTVSARAMLTAMIDGEQDPLVLADLAKGKLRRKIPDLAQALTGHFDANHARSWAEGGAGDHRRNRWRHGAVPDPRPLGRLGRVGAGDARVRRQTVPGREAARQQVVEPRCWSKPPDRSVGCTARTTWPPGMPGC